MSRLLRYASVALAVCALSLAGFARAEEKSSFTPAQKDEVRKLIRDYLVENPEVINEAINALQAKEDREKEEKQTAGVKAHKRDLFDTSEGTIIGNPKGDVTLVEFFDYNCGYCKSMFPQVMDVLKQDGKVRLIMKEFPILGAPSMTASKVALAARKQGKYSEFHIAMMSFKGSLNDDAIFKVAKDVGLDVKKLQDDMKDPEISTLINKNHALADDLAIDGTPALVIGDTLIPGAVGRGKLVELIASARK